MTAYFAHHAIHGRHGLENRRRLEDRASMLAAETARLETVRARLNRDVTLLRPDLPDPDIVDEIARDVLGYARPGDAIVRVRGR